MSRVKVVSFLWGRGRNVLGRRFREWGESVLPQFLSSPVLVLHNEYERLETNVSLKISKVVVDRADATVNLPLNHVSYPEIGDGNFNITHSHFIDKLLFKGS